MPARGGGDGKTCKNTESVAAGRAVAGPVGTERLFSTARFADLVLRVRELEDEDNLEKLGRLLLETGMRGELSVGWRMASTWALIGFAAQCLLAVVDRRSLADGVQRALFHYLAWGAIGFLVGSAIERVIDESVERYGRQQEENAAQTPDAQGSANASSRH